VVEDYGMDLRQAERLQEKLAARLVLEWRGGPIRRVAGADFGYDRAERKIAAAIVVMDLPRFEIVEVATAVRPVERAYLPGFLFLREGPAFVAAHRRLRHEPDVTLIDGNGIAHPRHLGLASHVGVLLDLATVGCAKTAFYPYRMPAGRRGSYTPYRDDTGRRVGFVLRTQDGVRPVFVSPGNLITLAAARKIVLDCSRFRIPEPLREAHRLSRELVT
jgi:deoxyribonuclease V